MGMVPWLNLQGAEETFNLSWLLARLCSVGDRPLPFQITTPLGQCQQGGLRIWLGRSEKHPFTFEGAAVMSANAEVHAWQSQPVHKEGLCYALGVVELPVGKGQGLHGTLLRDAPAQGTVMLAQGVASGTAQVSSGSTART